MLFLFFFFQRSTILCKYENGMWWEMRQEDQWYRDELCLFMWDGSWSRVESDFHVYFNMTQIVLIFVRVYLAWMTCQPPVYAAHHKYIWRCAEWWQSIRKMCGIKGVKFLLTSGYRKISPSLAEMWGSPFYLPSVEVYKSGTALNFCGHFYRLVNVHTRRNSLKRKWRSRLRTCYILEFACENLEIVEPTTTNALLCVTLAKLSLAIFCRSKVLPPLSNILLLTKLQIVFTLFYVS
jgi:hypothetical protein